MVYKPRGSFLVFEGINGSGKTTVLQKVASALADRHDKRVVTLCNPTHGPIGQEIRRVVAEQRAKGFPMFFSRAEETLHFATKLAVLFAADRLVMVDEVEGHLSEGRTVLCDRYALSSLVYQCAMVGDVEMTGAMARTIGAMHVGVFRPTTTIVFDVPVGVARARLSARGEQNDDRMMATLEPAACAMYRDARSMDPHGESNLVWQLAGDVEHVNADQPIDVVVDAVVGVVDGITF